MTQQLNEGLTPNALDHLVLPLITCDEYESKIDDRRVIVVGFYVQDLDPAEDLSMFIDKSSLDILDTEVSPAPTPDGYYVVFVEIRRDHEFPKTLIAMLAEIENLCQIPTWQMKTPGLNEPTDVTVESLEENLILDEKEIPELPDEDEEEKKDVKPEKKGRAKEDDEEETDALHERFLNKEDADKFFEQVVSNGADAIKSHFYHEGTGTVYLVTYQL